MTNVLTEEECRYLAHVKVAEQPTWTSITRSYNEKYEKQLDWRTLRAAMFREIPSDYWVGEMDVAVTNTLDNFFDKFGFTKLVMYMIGETVKEWKILNDMYIRYLLENKKLTDEEREELGPDVIQMDIWTIDRKDRLWDKLINFFFTSIDKAKGLNSTVEGQQIIAILTSSGLFLPGGESGTYPVDSDEQKALEEGQIGEYLEGLMERNKADLEANHAKHKAEARGIYRPMRERVANVGEEDFSEANLEDDDDIII